MELDVDVTAAGGALASQALNVTGDVTGTGTLASGLTVTLPTIATPGTFPKVTVDAKGRVTSGSALVSSDLTSAGGLLSSAVPASTGGILGNSAAGTLGTIPLTGGLTISASSQYDPNGNTVGRQVVDVLSTATPTSTATYTLAVSYNNADWPVQSTDNGLQTQAGYDAAGRLRSLSLPIPTPSGTPLISQVLYNVDGAGRATAVVEGPVAEPTYVAGFGYNPDNQLTGETLPGGVQAGATIDGAGRLIGLALSGPTATGTTTPVRVMSW